ncbi:polysaccharide biosynthesis C-terminal domain-containing protein [Salsuginibacillus kocurii]|uniref:lipid II flippase MurJ n=1 Tax=Salsuginibacillus kocurii TaxID=427078 RepID=UPI00036944EA|nr:polysaccharide biosynthesis C-terminal domain-containing protein [Salsuginibacillus kocurii]
MLKHFLNVLKAQASIKFVGVVFTVYLGSVYGAPFLGSYVLFISLMSLSLFLSKLGVLYSVEKKLSERRELIWPYVIAGLIINLTLLAFTIGLLLFFSSHLSVYIDESLISLLILSTVTGNCVNFLNRVNKSQKRFDVFANSVIIKEVGAKIIAAIILLVAPFLESIIICHVIANILASIYAFRYIPLHSITWPKTIHFKEIVYYSKFNVVLELRDVAINWADILIIGLVLTETHVGIYQLIWQLASGILIIAKSINLVCFPYFNTWFYERNFKQIKEFLGTKIYLFTLPIIPIFFGGIVVGEDLLILIGEDYKEGYIPLIILLFGAIFRSTQELYSKLLVAYGTPKYSFVISTISGIFNIILNIILIPLWGISGAAIATSISFILNNAGCYYYFHKQIAFKYYKQIILNNVLASIFMAVIILLVSSIYQLLVFYEIILGIVIWTLSMLLSKDIKNDGKFLMEKMKRRAYT